MYINIFEHKRLVVQHASKVLKKYGNENESYYKVTKNVRVR